MHKSCPGPAQSPLLRSMASDPTSGCRSRTAAAPAMRGTSRHRGAVVRSDGACRRSAWRPRASRRASCLPVLQGGTPDAHQTSLSQTGHRAMTINTHVLEHDRSRLPTCVSRDGPALPSAPPPQPLTRVTHQRRRQYASSGIAAPPSTRRPPLPSSADLSPDIQVPG